MRSSCLSEQELRAFHLGQLAEETLEEVARHLEVCPTCETLAQRLDTVLDPILAAIRAPAPPAAAPVTDQLQAVTPRLKAISTAPALRPPEDAEELGRLGNYRVLRQLGKGGMAFVYHAEDLALHRPVALKVMRPDLSSTADGWQRFFREARIMASIKHENLVTVYQAGQEGSAVYLAMELLQGEALEQRLERTGAVPWPEVLHLSRGIAKGLAAIHQHGLIHRDIKPGNIWIEAPSGQVKILDFGLARFLHDDVNITAPGTVMGTPAFMAPEQAVGGAADARSDLFSLGCVLYWLSTGAKAFDGPNTLAVLSALATQTPRPVHELNPVLPRSFSDLVAQLLAKNPAERPASVEIVLERLDQMEAGRDNTSRLPRLPSALTDSLRKIGRRRLTKIACILIVLGLLSALAWTIVSRRDDATGPSTQPAEPVYLNSLPMAESVWFPFRGKLPGPPAPPEPADWPPPLGGRRVFVQGKASPHGVWMHLPPVAPREVRVSFRLDKQYRAFDSEVSLNDGPPGCSPLTFAVYGDGRLLWRSEPVTSQANAQSCKGLSVENVDLLTLTLTGPGPERGTHAVWIEPHLTK
jgi:serine/threonine protein kinase